jgi:hypothetical protein
MMQDQDLAGRVRELEAENAALRREADVAGSEAVRWRSAAQQAGAEVRRLRVILEEAASLMEFTAPGDVPAACEGLVQPDKEGARE